VSYASATGGSSGPGATLTRRPARRKLPYCALDLDRHASSTNPATWTTFQQAVAAVEAGKADGIGFALAPPYVGIDLDAELPQPERELIVFALDSYAEESVSGTGLHVIVRASLDAGHHPLGFGVFQTGRFFYCSGKRLPGTRLTIEERQTELDAVLAQYLPPAQPAAPPLPRQPVDLDDRTLLQEKAFASKNGREIEELWLGNWEGRYPSQSEADLAFCNALAFWTGRDAARMDRLFRESGLVRKKWDQRWGDTSYGAHTIATAIAGCREVYKPFVRNVGPTVEGPLVRNVGPTVESAEIPVVTTREVPPNITDEQRRLAEVEAAFAEVLLVKDTGGIKVTLASVVANYAPGDALGTILVAPSGGGKSELVSSVKTAADVWPLSSLTPQTLLSGFERKGKKAGPPASMLLQIGKFGILAFKDLTTVLTMHREARAQIIGQLREVFDGRTEKSFGNGLRIEWEGKLGMVAGVTPVIDEQHAFLAVMGERFILYRLPELPRKELAERALAMRGREKAVRARIQALVSEFLEPHRDAEYLGLPAAYTGRLIDLADIVTRARSGVARDDHSRDILYLPEPEAPTRFAKQIAQLMAAMIRIGVEEDEAWRLAQKVGWDSVPAVRTSLLRILSTAECALSRAQVQERSGLPESTVRRTEEDLVVLGLVDRHKNDSGKWMVEPSQAITDYGAIPTTRKEDDA
jgi:NrS-1  polymerase HBD domain/IclR helix-turn-helix domain